MADYSTGIYEIRNLVNGKRYIGSAVNFGNRWRVHAQSLARGDHHSKQLQRSWRKYGSFAFQFNKLLACRKEDLLMYEQICIDTYKPEYNSAPKAGSNLGLKMSEEARAKMSAANNRRGNPGYSHTPDSRARISANRMGKGGGPRSPERLVKIGAAHRGRPKSEEHRAKIAATLKGHKQSAEQIEKRVSKLRGRKMPPGFAESASARMKGVSLGALHRESIARSKAKLSEEQVKDVRARLQAGERQKEIATLYRVDQSVVSEIKTGKSYRWVI